MRIIVKSEPVPVSELARGNTRASRVPAPSPYARPMLVVNRFRVSEADADAFRADLATAVDVLGERPGFVRAESGRNVDDPSLWVLATTWADVGSYRRALSAYDVKVTAVPLLSCALDEPSAYELVGPGQATPNRAGARELD